MIYKGQIGKILFENKVGGFPLLDIQIHFFKTIVIMECAVLTQGYSNSPMEQIRKANQILGQNPLIIVENLFASSINELASTSMY